MVTQEYQAEYGNIVEVDHGNELISRYAHASKVYVKKGDLVKRGQNGRSGARAFYRSASAL